MWGLVYIVNYSNYDLIGLIVAFIIIGSVCAVWSEPTFLGYGLALCSS